MLDWIVQLSAYLTAQGFGPHEQLIIGTIAGATLVNPTAYAFVKSTGFLARLVAAPFEARARRIREEARKERKLARLERKLEELSTLWTEGMLSKESLKAEEEVLPIILIDDDDNKVERQWHPLDPDEDVNLPQERCGLKF